MAIIAALGVLVIASPAFFFLGRKSGVGVGREAELERQAAAKATAEETAKRILADAEREVETMRKSAVVTGKEEVMRLREDAEQELRGRRAIVEQEERRINERESALDRKV
ncbi:MAG TPA: Rnase Y domain-containing protein, partial [Gemmatimonadaceae bacterium]|nr:Rnase Y domain-containing protein [Gemmatimonadaceae bacterium]